MMDPDIRETDLYREIARLLGDVRRPGSGEISDASQMHLSPDKASVAFAASVAAHAEEEPPTRLALVDLASGETRIITDGPNSDRLPRFSGDGRCIAFLSDRGRAGDFQLHLLDTATGFVRAAAAVRGQVEHLQWSADDREILLRVVGQKTDAVESRPAWLPLLEPSDRHEAQRSCWLYDVAQDTARRLESPDEAIWEATWRGDAIVTIASRLPAENSWYKARLCLFDRTANAQRTLYVPQEQLGPPAVSPDGSTIAVVEGLCSDRGPVVGELRLIDMASGACRTARTDDVDVIQAEWRSDLLLLLAGYRGLTTVIGSYDFSTDTFHELWSSDVLSLTAGCIAGLDAQGDCVLIAEGFRTAPEIATIRAGAYRPVRSFDIGYAAAVEQIAAIEPVTWPSSDGLQIQGWLFTPPAVAPHPLILCVHGGPVAHWRPGFLIRRMMHVPVLLRRGYAVFLPNPRGSTGRGQAFARRVLGDIGGGDARDVLTGLDALVARGLVDRQRIGVTGVSYGGFMTAWLITQSDRFGAAVAISPHTNQVTAHLLSNIPGFMAHLLGDAIGTPGGQYAERSPVLKAAQARTPTLSIAGAFDRCTPPGEAIQFHQALTEAGVESALAVYPLEGHGVRRLPAAIDCNARMIGWLTDHLSGEQC